MTYLESTLGPRPFAPAFRDYLLSGGVTDPSIEVGPRVWSFPLLSSGACRRLLEEIDQRCRESPAPTEPNSMHSYGVVLEQVGLGDLAQAFARLVEPLATRHFMDMGAGTIDGSHAFLAEYGAEADEFLGYHVDDSAVTLNLCLGDDFAGSEIYFRGLRCDEHRQVPATPEELFELEHEVGSALLHAGRHRHGVHPIRRGRRRNLILWMQSSAARRAAQHCATWCGGAGAP